MLLLLITVYHVANMIVSLATLLPIAIAYTLGALMKHSCYNYHLESMELEASLSQYVQNVQNLLCIPLLARVFMLSFWSVVRIRHLHNNGTDRIDSVLSSRIW